ncbi:hypothetical protein PMIN01_11958 [Paraphaeosphaeria minitans]|uniref:Uncharacterized protein n=1 Tax=Paraphaeosphaeria minitans TaxID=565426 RepID=A0A9P6G8Z4_9PLEO|nr:hypothetical protein PMIN01_11958 [Paraphaeosphaeria minitans]
MAPNAYNTYVYGPTRASATNIHQAWEICVPSHQFNYAIELLCSNLLSCTYEPVRHGLLPQPSTLSHLHPRFRTKDAELDIVLVPSFDVHIESTVPTLVYSASGVPYPALHIIVQSFLDTYDVVSLCDIIDGTDISEAWGHKFLDLSGTNDVQWAEQMNKRYFASIARGQEMVLPLFPTQSIGRQVMWETYVRQKKARLGWTHPDGVFDTRFRLKGFQYPDWEQKDV